MRNILLSEHETPVGCNHITVDLPTVMNVRREHSLLQRKARILGPPNLQGLDVVWNWNVSKRKLTAICNPSDELTFACINALLILSVPLRFAVATISHAPRRG